MIDAAEEVVLLAEDGTPVGRAAKTAVHGAETPLHLAFSCYGFDRSGRVLMTRRAAGKRVFPGIWTNTCCGHPAPGEFMEAAVARRLGQELGVVPEDLVCALPTFRYEADMGGVRENEICPVYLCRIGSELAPNPEEVDGFEWVAWDDYRAQALDESSGMSPWTRLQVRQLDTWGLVDHFLE